MAYKHTKHGASAPSWMSDDADNTENVQRSIDGGKTFQPFDQDRDGDAYSHYVKSRSSDPDSWDSAES